MNSCDVFKSLYPEQRFCAKIIYVVLDDEFLLVKGHKPYSVISTEIIKFFFPRIWAVKAHIRTKMSVSVSCENSGTDFVLGYSEPFDSLIEEFIPESVDEV